MKYVDEFRDRAVATALAERIKKTVRQPWTIMEVYGGRLTRSCDLGSTACCRKTSRWFMDARGTDY